jgi:predicted phage-related endonuclease
MDDVMNFLTRASKNGSAGEPGGRRLRYRRELIAERILGRAADHYVTRWMEEGAEREDEARSMYELATGEMVVRCGFVLHPHYDFTGATPDGLVGTEGVLEIKSPKPETLVEWLETRVVPIEYQRQCQWEMVCCERQWADFYGWYPGMPPFLTRIERDAAMIAEMEQAALSLHQEIEAFLAQHNLPPTVWDVAAEMKPQASADSEEEDAYDPSKSFLDNCDFLDKYDIPI